MTKKYDVIVIGAGPAGLMAARTAAENGLDTALLERKTDIPRVRRVDGGAIGVNEYLFDQMVTFNERAGRLCFPVSGFSVPYRGPWEDVYGFQVYSPGGERLLFGEWGQTENPARVGINLDKQVLLEGLLKECTDLGAEVFPGTNVTGIAEKQGRVEVAVSDRCFEGAFVIAADGINSRAARLLNFNRHRRFLGTERCVTWVMEGSIPVDPGSFNFIITEKATFAVTTSYRKNLFHVTYFSLNPRLSPVQMIEQFVGDDPVYAPWFKGARKVEVIACVVNHLSRLQAPLRGNTLLIGDAAWQMEFSNMAALCCGWKAANEISLALIDKKSGKEALSGYLGWWEKYFYGPCGGYDFGLGGGELQDYLSGEEIDYLAGLVTRPFPATMNFFSLFTSIGHTYAELFPAIQEQRPEVMEKLITMRENMEAEREKTVKKGFPNR